MCFCTSEKAAVQHPLLLRAASPSEHISTVSGTFQQRVKQRRSHLSPVCFLLLSPEGEACMRVGCSHGSDSWAVQWRRLLSPTTWSCTGQHWWKNCSPLTVPPLSGWFGFEKDTYGCTHAHRNVIYTHIRGALCVRGINLRRQIALRLC